MRLLYEGSPTGGRRSPPGGGRGRHAAPPARSLRNPPPIAATYTNPLHGDYLADPFVTRFNGCYYAYGTAGAAGVTVRVLRSLDLVSWEPVDGVLQPLVGDDLHYWAPEVVYDNGTYYMYFSAGGPEGEGHVLHVATASDPTGPFVDAGVVLTPHEEFSIDAHPFRDDDGCWYLFYCRDFLDGERVGTGIVVDRLVEMTRLEGRPQTVIRPYADWNLYEAGRRWRGRVGDWYTIEGPFVRKRDGRYYCFYSGGAWREPSYGLACADADAVLGPYGTERTAGRPDILSTVPDRVIGPGHASVVKGPDLLAEYVVYHAWDPAHRGRQMRMERLGWTAEGPRCAGASIDEQPAPSQPLVHASWPAGATDRAEERWSAAGWEVDGGSWRRAPSGLFQAELVDRAVATPRSIEPLEEALVEIDVRLVEVRDEVASYGVLLQRPDAGDHRWETLEFVPGRGVLRWRLADGDAISDVDLELDRWNPRFRFEVRHTLRLRRVGPTVEVSVDEVPLARTLPIWEGRVLPALVTRGAAVCISAITITGA